ncbi:MAG: phosphoribosylaminoimidazolesuccinocarboxamide synthase [Balneolales bacterium]
MNTIHEALSHCVVKTTVPDLPEPYRGKVRDVYSLPHNKLAFIASDRVSAFDHVLRQAIPYKGQILNIIAAYFFDNVRDIIETHLLDVPHPNVTIARKCNMLPVEVVLRRYLTGHAWRTYRSGKRELCGVTLPDGMVENQRFDKPILTPATKADEGHDEDISEKEILAKGIIDGPTWNKVRNTAFQLFERGTQMAIDRGLLLVDTKYEFGIYDGRLILADEVHTPDSSRYFYADGFEERLGKGQKQKQLSKEFIREWLMEHNFQGLNGQTLPELPDPFRIQVYERYSELYELIIGKPFEPRPTLNFNAELSQILNVDQK